MNEKEIRASMTSEQIQLERKLTCEAINGAMAFGYQNTNPPPSDDHWLAPFWNVGRRQGELAATANDLSRVYDVFGIGREARSIGVLLENVRNSHRRAQCLSEIERFFTRDVPADFPEEEGDTIEECPLNWGSSPAQYIEQFKAALSASIADTAEPLPVYQIAFSDEDGWCDTYKEIYDKHPEHMRRTLYMRPVAEKSIADTAGAKPVTLPSLKPRLLNQLRRFNECCTDPQAGGHDVDREDMHSLAVFGAVRPAPGGRHYVTDFGAYVLAIAATPASSVADAQVDDLRMLVQRLVHALNKASPSNDLGAKALDYLQRNGIGPSPLRESSVADAAGASEDARDAARYRYLRNAVGVILDCSHAGPWKFGEAVDKQADEWLKRKAAIAKESGND